MNFSIEQILVTLKASADRLDQFLMANLGELRMKMTQCWKSLSLENSIIDIAGTGTSHGLERNIERLRQSWGRSDVQGHDAALTVMLN